MAQTTVKAEQIAINAISGTIIADNAITSVHIAQNAILTQHIDDGQVGTAQLAADAVTSAKLADSSVVTANIQDDQVTGDKLANNITIAGTLTSTGAFTTTGDLTVTSSTSNKPVVNIKNTNADATPPYLNFIKDSASPADNDEVGRIYMYGDDDGGNAFEAVLIRGITTDVSNGSEDSTLEFFTYSGGSQTSTLTLASGNAGIGGAPATAAGISQYLTIYGGDSGIALKDSSANDTVELYNAGGKLYVYGGTGGSNGDRFQLDCVNTRLGIGTMSPNNTLDVNGGIVCSPNTDGKDTFELSTHASNEGRLRIKNVDTTTVQIRAGGDTYFNGGNVLIGKTSTGIDVTGFTFDSNGNSNMVCNLTSENESIIYNNNNNSGAKYIHDFRQNGTSVGKIEVGTNSTALVPNSDYRLKENIKTLSNGLDRVKKLNPVQFDWKKDGETSEGFLAHEVQEAGWNEGVTGTKDGERMQGVDYGRMTPLLVKAIQELSAKNDALEARIKTLEDA